MSDFIDHTNSPPTQTLGAESTATPQSVTNPELSSMNPDDDTSSSYDLANKVSDFVTPRNNRIDVTDIEGSVTDTNATTVAIDKAKRKAKLEADRDLLIIANRIQQEKQLQDARDMALHLQELEEERLLEQQIEELRAQLVEKSKPSANFIDLAQIDSASTTSTASVLTNVVPTRIDTEVRPQREMAIVNYRDIIVLKDTITPKLANDFYQQSLQANQALTVDHTILPEAMNNIRMRIKTSYKLLKISEEAAKDWCPKNLTVREIAFIIYQIYGASPKTATPVQIEAAINAFNWGFDLDNKYVEEESYKNLVKLITDHYGAIELIDTTIQEDICKQVYKKLPNQTEMNRAYKLKKDKECPKGTPDTIIKALDRYLSCIQDVRDVVETARAHASMGQRWFSGPTHEKQNTVTSTNEVISYGVAAQRAATHMANLVIPHTRDTDWHERNRTINNRCETCGKTNHQREVCKLYMNRCANSTSTKWHFSAIGTAFRNAGFSHFTDRVTLPGYGKPEWSNRVAPPNHVYPDEDNPTGKDLPKAVLPKVNNFMKQVRAYTEHKNNNQYNTRPTYHGNNPKNFDNNNNNNNSDSNNYNDNYKRPRSESSQYVAALMNSVRNKLLPIRIYLDPQGRTETAIAAKRASRVEVGADHMDVTDSGTIITTTSTAARTDHDQTAHTQTGPRALMVKVEALLDSGSLAGDFINANTLAKLGGTHYMRDTADNILVCSGLDNQCLESNVVLDVIIEFDVNDLVIKMNIPVRMSNNSPLECIIGIDTMIKYNIVQLLPHFFLSDVTITALRKRMGLPANKKQKIHSLTTEGTSPSDDTDNDRAHRCSTECRECTSAGEATLPDIVIPVCDTADPTSTAPKRKHVRSVHFDDTPLEKPLELIIPPAPEFTPAQTPQPVAALIREVEQLLEVNDFGDEGIDYDQKDMFAPFRKSPEGQGSLIDKITICGSEEQKKRIKALCVKYKQIFSDELDATPAHIPPFDLKVDKTKWETHKNRGAIRQQSAIKQDEIVKQVNEMAAAGIIEKSQATYYSQVMLTPKPNGTWRFCVDYRNMNDATENASWPIPNIADLLRRLGRSKADTFGVMDLTSGYHQAPLSLACKAFTAFITFAGVYQFTRLPFGPKRAPSYFQEQMATVVLAGMIYVICEMYLDDCIVYGQGMDDFCDKLEKVFIRFDEKHIFLKAIKCKLGMSEVEYVGKTISKEGIRMSEKQIQGVMDFPKPVNNTQLRSFLGFVNYFREHVPNHSNVVHPLHAMVDHSATKQTKILWTPEGHLAFEKIKQLISVSPKLYFIHDTAPITLETDASDYGVGGYLYQTIDNKKQLVALVSKALSKTQLRWSVIQKEAYGIFFCCTQLDRMLRDRKFKILTDHKNLMFIKMDSNPMVVRWWMALQELDFEIEYIKGDQNEIADALSRLCINRKENAPRGVVSAILPTNPISQEHYSAIAACHNTMVGHSGVERTIKKLKSLKLNWPYMRQNVWTFIQDCPCCQKMSHLRPPVNALKYTTSTYRPMECLNIDFLGPYPDEGYLLVVIDTFTRYVCIYPTPDASAASAARALTQHLGQFGSPKEIRSDNGPHFTGKIIDEFLKLVGTRHDKTMVYSKEENSIVERCNKEINKYILAFTYDRASNVDYQEIIPFVTRLLNTNVNEKMKVSPAQLIYGNAINLDRGILTPFDESQISPETLTTFSSKMLAEQKTLMQIARDNLLLADGVHNSKVANNLTEYDIGTHVLALPRTQPKTRMHTLWTGPYRILEKDGDKYKVLDLIQNKTKMYHVTQLKEFRFDPTKTDPTDVARRDHHEFFVEAILEFKGDIKRVSTLTFHVKWLTCDESMNSWEPWAFLRDNEVLHKYLIKINLRHLIPRKFQLQYAGTNP
jgi:hypothetical protein